jgi:hypothetical protein
VARGPAGGAVAASSSAIGATRRADPAAGAQYQGFSSVRALVAVIETALRRYLAAGFRFERSLPAAPAGARGLLWEILSENQGRPLSGSTIRDALAGIARKSNRKMYTGAPIPRRFGSKSGTKRDARSREKATADKGR